MRKLLITATVFALVVPAAFAAPPSDKGNDAAPNPAQLCAEQLKTMGAQGFQSTYAPTGNGRNAMGKCISRQAQAASGDQQNAAKTCKAELESQGEAKFADTYGTNGNKKNAFGKCVSMHAQQSADDRQESTLNAAKQCKAERAKVGSSTFATTYGTNKNKRNAFGKCVSKLAKEQGT